MNQTPEPVHTTAMATKVASTVMRMSGWDRSVTISHPGALPFVPLDDAASHSLPEWPGDSEPLDWEARHDISPTPHLGKLAGQAEARGHPAVGGRRTRDANGFAVSTDNSATRSGRWS
jgi:hypothetical protein